MLKWLAAYLCSAGTLLLLDLLWLGWLARAWYAQGIGHLMAEQPWWPAAVAFYLIYPLGLLVFALAPNAATAGLWSATGAAALLGFFAYATYDLSNLATLKSWPLSLSLIDIAWGCSASALSALAGKAALDRLG